jgi:hypothetical protein
MALVTLLDHRQAGTGHPPGFHRPLRLSVFQLASGSTGQVRIRAIRLNLNLKLGA